MITTARGLLKESRAHAARRRMARKRHAISLAAAMLMAALCVLAPVLTLAGDALEPGAQASLLGGRSTERHDSAMPPTLDMMGCCSPSHTHAADWLSTLDAAAHGPATDSASRRQLKAYTKTPKCAAPAPEPLLPQWPRASAVHRLPVCCAWPPPFLPRQVPRLQLRLAAHGLALPHQPGQLVVQRARPGRLLLPAPGHPALPGDQVHQGRPVQDRAARP